MSLGFAGLVLTSVVGQLAPVLIDSSCYTASKIGGVVQRNVPPNPGTSSDNRERASTDPLQAETTDADASMTITYDTGNVQLKGKAKNPTSQAGWRLTVTSFRPRQR